MPAGSVSSEVGPGAQPVLPCFRCGVCCTQFQAIIDVAELQRIARYFGSTVEAFSARYIDPRWPGRDSFLLQGGGAGCVFLEHTGRLTRCRIHEVKPRSCRDWGAAASQPQCREGLAERWRLIMDLSGRPQGRPADVRRFRRFLETLPGL